MEKEVALARIHIGEPFAGHYDPEGNSIYPFRDCFVITTAGQIWDIRISAFGADENRLRTLWSTDRSKFTKREL